VLLLERFERPNDGLFNNLEKRRLILDLHGFRMLKSGALLVDLAKEIKWIFEVVYKRREPCGSEVVPVSR